MYLYIMRDVDILNVYIKNILKRIRLKDSFFRVPYLKGKKRKL